jgi:FkbM family methyltransferase
MISRKIDLFRLRFRKFLYVIRKQRLRSALLRHQVLAGAEHNPVFLSPYNTIVDIGSNNGQFCLAAIDRFPSADFFCFEPLKGPCSIFRKVFQGNLNVHLFEAGIGQCVEDCYINVSAKSDSSSLLPITSTQTQLFPGTHKVDRQLVKCAPLDFFISPLQIKHKAMLKIDVQGYEYEVLKGCDSLLHLFDSIYCECSFIELYEGQKLAGFITEHLSRAGFEIAGIYNPTYDSRMVCIQADFLFKNVARMS